MTSSEPAPPASRTVVARPGHTGIVWLTGLPSSGKSTLAELGASLAGQRGIATAILDGDRLRTRLCAGLGFTPEDRAENVRRAGEAGRLLVDAGVLVFAALISPYVSDRARVRAMFPPGTFMEVFVDTPVEVCEARDVKGLYARVRAGSMRGLTGVDAPYERPSEPELRVLTQSDAPLETARLLLSAIEARGWLGTSQRSDRGH